ncbi:transposase, partial [mine drainage metagenome]
SGCRSCRDPGKVRLRELRGELTGLVGKTKGRRGFCVVPEKVEEDELRDGRRLLFSTDVETSAKEMCRAYFERDAIEKSFRTAKGPMSLAPIRYRSEVRLDAYATVLYLGLLLWS